MNKTNKTTKPKTVTERKALANSMNGLVSGIVPFAAGSANAKISDNAINSTAVLAAQIRREFVTLDRALLSSLYQQFGIVQALIEVPVLDAFRGGVKLSAYERAVAPEPIKKKSIFKIFTMFNEADPAKDNAKDNKPDVDSRMFDERKKWEEEQDRAAGELKKSDDNFLRRSITPEELRMLEIYIKREMIWDKVQEAEKWKRLFGGSGIVILDGKDPSTPINLEAINQDTPLEFYVADNWELSASSTTLNSVDWMSEQPFTYYGHKIHKSRVIVFNGKKWPSLWRSVGRGWGMSALEPLIRTLNKGIKNENLIFELQDEAKIDVFKLNDFNDSMLDPDSTAAVQNRLQLGQTVKNYMKAIVLDGQDEYSQKQIHFNGLAELKEDNRVDMAADARITMTKLYGTTPAGFNSGESDRESYADSVESEIRIPLEPNIIKLLEIVGRKVLGKTLDFGIEFQPLIRTTEYEAEKTKTLRLANLNEGSIWGRVNNVEWTKAVNASNIFGTEISYKPKFVPEPLAKQVFKPGFGGK